MNLEPPLRVKVISLPTMMSSELYGLFGAGITLFLVNTVGAWRAILYGIFWPVWLSYHVAEIFK